MNEPNEPREDQAGDERLSTADLAGAASTTDERAVEERTFAQREAPAADDATLAGEEPAPALFAADQAGELRHRWDAVQASFVDEPRAAVKQADELVASAIKQLAETFAAERDRLEGQWDRGDDVSTEDLRVVLRRYRSFFTQLLAI